MQAAQGLQAPSRQTTTKDIYSRHGMQRTLVSSSTGCTAGPSCQAQQQRPHAVLQRCHSLLVRQSASSSGATTAQQQPQQQQQQVVTQQPDLPLQQQTLQTQEQQQQQQQQWQQERPPQLLPFPGDSLSQPATSYSSNSSSRSIGGNGAAGTNSYPPPAALAAAALAAAAGGEASTSGRPWSPAADASNPAHITYSIRNAGSTAELDAVVCAHAAAFNCIHCSAAFIQLQRLWPQQQYTADDDPSSSSSSSNSYSRSDLDDWVSSSSTTSSTTSSTPNSSSSSSSPATARQLLLRLQSVALSVPRIDGRFVSNVLYSLAVLHSVHEERAAYSSQLVNRLCAAAFSLANSMPPQELSTLVWSLVRLGVVPAPALLRRLASNILRQLPGFKPQDLLMTLTALPALHQTPGVVAPYATVHKLAAAAGQVMPAASAHEAAGLLAALGALQWRAPPAWLAAYWAAAAPKLAGMGWQQLGMVGWGLGQLAPLSESPSQEWVQAWEGAITQQLLLAASPSSSLSSSSSSSGTSSSSQVPVVELVMVLYGWSKALPQQPPDEQLQQLLLNATQAALASSSSSGGGGLSIKQQRQQQQQRQRQVQQNTASWQQQQQHPQQQQQHWQLLTTAQQHLAVDSSSGSSSSSSHPGLNPRLLGELVSVWARWQLLPPRQWLLQYLSVVQQQLLRGQYSCRDLSSTLWGLATLGVRPSTPWLDSAAAAAEQQMAVQAQTVLQLRQQQQAWQQQRTQEWAARQQMGGTRKGSASAAAGAAAGVSSRSLHHASVVERLGLDSQRQLQQYTAVPKQLAVLLWSLAQLQYRPGVSFWDQFWALSGPLLPRQYNVRDLAATLDAVLLQQQQPPQRWVRAALKAGGSIHMRPQQQFAPADSSDQQQQYSRGSKPQPLQQQQQDLQQQQFWSGLRERQQRQFLRDVLRMLWGFGRLGVSAGQAWCGEVLEKAVRPHAALLTAQDTCQLLWALGSCGYSPPGRALPPWLHAHLLATLPPPAAAALHGASDGISTTTSSSSSSDPLNSSSGDVPGKLFPGLGVGPTVQLLVGLRKSRVVVGGRWLSGLLQASEEAAAAAALHPQVYIQLLSYVASTAIPTPSSWTAAMVAALPTLLQQQQQQQEQKPALLLSLLSCLHRLGLQLQPGQVQQLQQAAAAVTPHASAEASERVWKLLAALQRRNAQQQ